MRLEMIDILQDLKHILLLIGKRQALTPNACCEYCPQCKYSAN